jgi:hypothetical protein
LSLLIKIFITLFNARRFREEKEIFYDATVLEVFTREHQNGTCLCEFEIQWGAGPAVGTVCKVDISKICLLSKRSILTHPLYERWTGDPTGMLDEERASSGAFQHFMSCTNYARYAQKGIWFVTS